MRMEFTAHAVSDGARQQNRRRSGVPSKRRCCGCWGGGRRWGSRLFAAAINLAAQLHRCNRSRPFGQLRPTGYRLRFC